MPAAFPVLPTRPSAPTVTATLDYTGNVTVSFGPASVLYAANLYDPDSFDPLPAFFVPPFGPPVISLEIGSSPPYVSSTLNNAGLIWNYSSLYGATAVRAGFVTNSGWIIAEAIVPAPSGSGFFQVVAKAVQGASALDNSGTIYAIASGYANAVSVAGLAQVTNSGTIAARSVGSYAPGPEGIGGAEGIVAGEQMVEIVNTATGRIIVEGGLARAVSLYGGIPYTITDKASVTNHGLIEATSTAAGHLSMGVFAAAIFEFDVVTVINDGTIRADIAVFGADSMEDGIPGYFLPRLTTQIVRNLAGGLLDGEVILKRGDDAVYNQGTIDGNVDMGLGWDLFDGTGGTVTGLVDMGDNDDDFLGGSGADLARGGFGNDVLLGAAGADLLLGDGNDDTIRGDGGNDGLYGGTGNDWLITEGGDIAEGGLGDDAITTKDYAFARISGGTGFDIWELPEGTRSLDLAQVVASGRVLGIDQIHLGTGKTVTIHAADVTALSDDNFLAISGAAGSTVYLAGGWTAGATSTINGHTVRDYTLGAATVRIDTAATVTLGSPGVAGGGLDAMAAGPAAALPGTLPGSALLGEILTTTGLGFEYDQTIDPGVTVHTTTASYAVGTFLRYDSMDFVNYGTIFGEGALHAGGFYEGFTGTLANYGLVRAAASGSGMAEGVVGSHGLDIRNYGSIVAEAVSGEALAVNISSGYDLMNPSIINEFEIYANSTLGRATAIAAASWGSVRNLDTIYAYGGDGAIAIDYYRTGSNMAGNTVDNSGLILAEAGAGATGPVIAIRMAQGSVTNSGEIAGAIAIEYHNTYGTETIANTGSIYGAITSDSVFAGLFINNFAQGTITGDMLLGRGRDTIQNYNVITGDIFTRDDADTILNHGSARIIGVVNMGLGNDSYQGGAFQDLVTGDAGADTLLGNGGNDLLIGSFGNDSLEGGDGADGLYGEQGDDLIATLGADVVKGGKGNDMIRTGDYAFALIAGEAGADSWVLPTGARVLDLSAVAASGRVTTIERIEASGSQELVLRQADVAGLSGGGTRLIIALTGTDKLDLVGGWTSQGNVTQGTVTYASYALGGTTVLVEGSGTVAVMGSAPGGALGLDAIAAGGPAPEPGEAIGLTLTPPFFRVSNTVIGEATTIDAGDNWFTDDSLPGVRADYNPVPGEPVLTVNGTLTSTNLGTATAIAAQFTDLGKIVVTGRVGAYSSGPLQSPLAPWSNSPTEGANAIRDVAWVVNNGDIEARAEHGVASAIGLAVQRSALSLPTMPEGAAPDILVRQGSFYTVERVENNARINVSAYDGPGFGMVVGSTASNAATGTINVDGTTLAVGVLAAGAFTNAGSIIALAGGGAATSYAIAMVTDMDVTGEHHVVNSGLARGTYAVAVTHDPDATYTPALRLWLENSGTLDGMVAGSETGDLVMNSGTITGTISLGLGNDSFDGSTGMQRDEVLGGSGDDTLRGGTGNDYLDGGAGNDQLVGNGGDDTLTGGFGSDSLSGGGGNDQFSWTGFLDGPVPEVAAGDTVDGGSGTDTLFFYLSEQEATLAQLTYSNVERVISGGFTALRLTGTELNQFSEVSGLFRLIGSGAVTLGAINLTSSTFLLDDTITAFNFAAATYTEVRVDGGAGDSTITAGNGINNIDGGGGNDTINGGSGYDALHGGLGNDVLNGNADNDQLYGGGGLDRLFGGIGDDQLFTGGIGTVVAGEVYDGGTGWDMLDMSDPLSPDSFAVDLTGVTITSIESLGINPQGTATLTRAQMGGVSQLLGNFVLSDGGAIALSGTSFTTTRITLASAGNAIDISGAVPVGVGARLTIIGDAGDDTITAGAFAADLKGGAGNDTYIIAASAGNFATLVEQGGQGIDTVLTDRPSYTLGAEFERLWVRVPTSSALSFTGNGLDNWIKGSLGNDSLVGDAGNDTLEGGGGADSLDGGFGNDRIVLTASAGAHVTGGAGTDVLAVSGAVSLAGLSGIEAIELSAGAALTLTGSQFYDGLPLAASITGSGSITVNMEADVLFISKLDSFGGTIAMTVNGTSGTDIMKLGNVAHTANGGDGIDQIKGGSGADTIDGGAGIDKINGAGGADLLTGGADADVFKYANLSDSAIGLADHITDFVIGTDRLNFKEIDPDAVTAGDQAFAFIGTTAFHASGAAEIRYLSSGGNIVVQVDADGNGTADMEIVLNGLAGQTMTAADFVL